MNNAQPVLFSQLQKMPVFQMIIAPILGEGEAAPQDMLAQPCVTLFPIRLQQAAGPGWLIRAIEKGIKNAGLREFFITTYAEELSIIAAAWSSGIEGVIWVQIIRMILRPETADLQGIE